MAMMKNKPAKASGEEIVKLRKLNQHKIIIMDNNKAIAFL
jgi:hypothetical protein